MTTNSSCNPIGCSNLGEVGGGVGLGVETSAVKGGMGLLSSWGGGDGGGEGGGVGLGVGTRVAREPSLLVGGV